MINGPTTKERLINATLMIISDEGFQKVTIRKIAAIANVNVAAVNYHFGSKDIIINEALKYITIQMQKAFDMLKNMEEDPETRLRYFLQNYSDTALRYPDILKNFINQTMKNYTTIPVEYEQYLEKEGFELIKTTIKEIRPDEDNQALYMRVLQILSCLAFPILLGDIMKEAIGIDYKNNEQRHAYLEVLLQSVVKGQ